VRTYTATMRHKGKGKEHIGRRHNHTMSAVSTMSRGALTPNP